MWICYKTDFTFPKLRSFDAIKMWLRSQRLRLIGIFQDLTEFWVGKIELRIGNGEVLLKKEGRRKQLSICVSNGAKHKTEGPDRSHQGQGFAEQSSSSLQAQHALSPPIPPPSHHSRALYSSPWQAYRRPPLLRKQLTRHGLRRHRSPHGPPPEHPRRLRRHQVPHRRPPHHQTRQLYPPRPALHLPLHRRPKLPQTLRLPRLLWSDHVGALFLGQMVLLLSRTRPLNFSSLGFLPLLFLVHREQRRRSRASFSPHEPTADPRDSVFGGCHRGDLQSTRFSTRPRRQITQRGHELGRRRLSICNKWGLPQNQWVRREAEGSEFRRISWVDVCFEKIREL